MVAKVVVCVGDEHRKDHSSPEFTKVHSRRCRVDAHRIGDLHVASRLSVLCLEQAHGGWEWAVALGEPGVYGPIDLVPSPRSR